MDKLNNSKHGDDEGISDALAEVRKHAKEAHLGQYKD